MQCTNPDSIIQQANVIIAKNQLDRESESWEHYDANLSELRSQQNKQGCRHRHHSTEINNPSEGKIMPIDAE